MKGLMMTITNEYSDLVNEIVPKTRAEGAYCIGLVSALAWQHDLDPTRAVLEAAADCNSIPDALEMFDTWRKLQQHEKSTRTSRPEQCDQPEFNTSTKEP